MKNKILFLVFACNAFVLGDANTNWTVTVASKTVTRGMTIMTLQFDDGAGRIVKRMDTIPPWAAVTELSDFAAKTIAELNRGPDVFKTLPSQGDAVTPTGTNDKKPVEIVSKFNQDLALLTKMKAMVDIGAMKAADQAYLDQIALVDSEFKANASTITTSAAAVSASAIVAVP